MLLSTALRAIQKTSASGYDYYVWGRDGTGISVTYKTVFAEPGTIAGLQATEGSIGGACLFIKPDGTLWGFGQNNFGSLGQNDIFNRSSPVQIGSDTNWASVTVGSNGEALAIKTNGTLWAWGRNVSGTLGTNDAISRSSPVQIGSDTNWSKVVTQGASYALKTNGTIWSWGPGFGGALGLGDTADRSSPTQIGSDTNWIDIVPAGALKSNNTLWTWSSITGNGTATATSSPVQIGGAEWASIGFRTPSVAANTIAIKTNGTLWAWGSNTRYQLGNTGGTMSSPIQIGSATNWVNSGQYTNNAIWAKNSSNEVWSWGAQYGSAVDVLFSSSPVQIASNVNKTFRRASNYLVFTDSSNNMYFFSGNNDNANGITNNNFGGRIGTPYLATEPSKWNSISLGFDRYAVGVKNDGTLWSWGSNQSGQLGRNNFGVFTNSPVQIGSGTDWYKVWCGRYNVAAVKTDGTAWVWGENNPNGQLGLGDVINRSSPVQLGSGTDWAKVVVTLGASAGLKTNGTLWTWGLNSSGQLGLGDLISRSSPVQVGAGTNWADITLYGEQQCDTMVALKADGTMWAWGNGFGGQLGINLSGATASRSSPVQVGSAEWAKISAGANAMYAVKTNGTLWSWGSDSSGALGLNTSFIARSSPTQIGSGTDWANVAGGTNYAFAIKTNGTLWAWGSSTYSELGNNSTVTSSSPVQVGSATDWETDEIPLFTRCRQSAMWYK